MQQLSSAQASPEVPINENFAALAHQAVYGKRAPATSGLVWGYYGGRWGGMAVADGTLTLAASATNYVVVAAATATISASSTSTNWDSDDYLRVYKLTTSGSAVTAEEDHRAGTRGVHGGGGASGSSTGGGTAGALDVDTDVTLAANSDVLIASQKATKAYVDSQTDGAGLEYFAESLNSSSPNESRFAVRLIAVGTTAAVDLVLSPKSTGSVSRSLADGTATGGNKRGPHATDWQGSRSAATQVASGQDSFAAGASNTASGPQAVAMGDSNNATGGTAPVSIGLGNTASGYASTNIGGTYNVADGTRSITLGGSYQHSRGIHGITSFGTAGQALVSANKRQGELHALAVNTSDATSRALGTDGDSGGSTNQILLNNNSLCTVTGTATARQGATGDAKGWTFSATVKRGSSASATAVLGSPTVTVTGNDAGAAAWGLAIVADTTNGALQIQATGEASKTIVWQAAVLASFCSA